MALELGDNERAIINGSKGEGAAMALRIVARTAELMGARRLIPIASAHIDGALYHGDSGTYFAEKLVEGQAKVSVRATLNVGSLDLTGCSGNRLPAHQAAMAKRMMRAYIRLGCEPSWTCAPYQAGHRPLTGTDVAWGESNAVVFCNSVLGARTNRYGDYLDIACAIAGLAPDYGLHRPENRHATVLVDISALNSQILRQPVVWPVLGNLYGRLIGDSIGVIVGHILNDLAEDDLKAFGAAAASSGAVGLFHVAGRTPEAPDSATALHGSAPLETIKITSQMLQDARRHLSTVIAEQIDAVAIGSPHLSLAEFDALEAVIAERQLAVPLYACTGRHVLRELDKDNRRQRLERAGVIIVADTCVVVTPILPEKAGAVLMTNSGKFAHYAPGNTGYGVVYGSLSECVESAVSGRVCFSTGQGDRHG